MFVDLREPALLTEGDRPQFLAMVHNLTGKQGPAKLTLRLQSGQWQSTVPLDIELTNAGTQEFTLTPRQAIPATESLQLSLTLEADFPEGLATDALVTQIPVRPWGLEHVDLKSGTLSSAVTEWLQLPTGREYRNRQLELYVGRSFDHLLLEEALRRGVVHPLAVYEPMSHADTASQLWGVTSLLKMFNNIGPGTVPEYADLLALGESLVARLVSAQRSDGGWAWSHPNGGSQAQTTSLALVALRRAQEVGLLIPDSTLQQAMNYASQEFRARSLDQDELKAMLLFALAAHGQADFGAANRLHRDRGSLSPAALAYVTLALVEMNRLPMARDVAQQLEPMASKTPTTPCRVQGNTAWNRSALEMTALAGLALQRAMPNSNAVETVMQYLLQHRPWFPARAAGAALTAVAEYYGATKPTTEPVAVEVLINDRTLTKVTLDDSAPGRRIAVQPEWFEGDAQVKVEFRMTGRGNPYYVAALRGFSTDLSELKADRFQITRQRYEADLPRYNGRVLPTGFRSVKRTPSEFANLVSELELGSITRVQVNFYRDTSTKDVSEHDYLVLEIPIPAGTSVLAGSVSGRLESHEITRNRVFCFIGPHRGSGSVQFSLVGVMPGEYRVLPPQLRNAYVPSDRAIGKATTLTVLGRDIASSDTYRPTPDELLARGRAEYQAKEFEAARVTLERLFREWERQLTDDALKEVSRYLLYLSIEANDSQNIVKFFEILRERDPDLYVDLDQMMRVGSAYRTLEEYERSLLIFAAITEENFRKDLKVSGTLQELDQFLGSIRALERLWLEYPSIPSVAELLLTMSDALVAKAPEALATGQFRDSGLSFRDLYVRGVNHLKQFLVLHPNDPLAPEAGLGLVSAILGLKDYESAAKIAERFANRGYAAKFHDSFRYTQAVALWYLGQVEQAQSLLQEIAAARYQNASGVESFSPNRDLSHYILGQIHHAQLDPDGAIRYYEKVANLYVDAKEAIADLRRQEIRVEEVTIARPGQAVTVPMTWRNMEKAEILVYSVDLMTLYLREKNLSRITDVNLAGIRPQLRFTHALEPTRVRTKETEVPMDLTEPGAYLVMVRGGDQHASGLVLISPLALQVAEDPSGRVRVQVFDETSGTFVRDAEVKVIGSNNAEFQSGETDPRGLFVADGLQGSATVIARHGTRDYAFHRGAVALGDVVDSNWKDKQEATEGDYFKNVLELNRSGQSGRAQRLREVIQTENKGVQIRQVR